MILDYDDCKKMLKYKPFEKELLSLIKDKCGLIDHDILERYNYLKFSQCLKGAALFL